MAPKVETRRQPQPRPQTQCGQSRTTQMRSRARNVPRLRSLASLDGWSRREEKGCTGGFCRSNSGHSSESSFRGWRTYFKYDLTMSITSSAAATCCEVGFCFPIRTWLRIWPSRSSAIRLFMAPLAALITCRTSEQSRSSLRVRTSASTCPRIRLARRTSFSSSLIVWLIGFLAPSRYYHTRYGIGEGDDSAVKGNRKRKKPAVVGRHEKRETRTKNPVRRPSPLSFIHFLKPRLMHSRASVVIPLYDCVTSLVRSTAPNSSVGFPKSPSSSTR